MEQNNPHENHRDRVRSMMVQNGVDSMPEHLLLEFLLYHTIPRRDVNDLAHALIERYGSFHGVLDAGYEALLHTAGVGRITAALLSVLPGIFRVYQREQTEIGHVFKDVEAVGEYLSASFVGCAVETVAVAFLDSKFQLIDKRTVATGSVTQVGLPLRRIVELALSLKAASVVLGHNHPCGLAIPSQEDIYATRAVKTMLDALGIELKDHIVSNGSDYVSMLQSGYLSGEMPAP